MKTFEVILTPSNGGNRIIETITTSGTMSQARQIAENRNPGYRSLTVKQI